MTSSLCEGMLKRHAFSLSSARNHVFLQTNSLVSDMSTPEKRVLVGMSGGIDSTATCLMLKEQGYENNINEQRLHHEIYMSDARKVAPEKWKTVIRHPIKKV